MQKRGRATRSKKGGRKRSNNQKTQKNGGTHLNKRPIHGNPRTPTLEKKSTSTSRYNSVISNPLHQDLTRLINELARQNIQEHVDVPPLPPMKQESRVPPPIANDKHFLQFSKSILDTMYHKNFTDDDIKKFHMRHQRSFKTNVKYFEKFTGFALDYLNDAKMHAHIQDARERSLLSSQRLNNVDDKKFKSLVGNFLLNTGLILRLHEIREKYNKAGRPRLF